MLSGDDTIRPYLRRIGEYPLVTPAEEATLAGQIARGSEEARQTLIHSNLRLVVKIARDFSHYGLPLSDLISEGNIGLMRAVEKFDPTKGAKLSSYASWWIKQGMLEAVSSQVHTIRVPSESASKMGKIRAAHAKLTAQYRRYPTDAEIAAEAKLTRRTVTRLRVHQAPIVVSFNDPIQPGEDDELGDLIPDPAVASIHTLQEGERLTHLRDMVRGLDEREQTVLNLRFGLNGEPPRTLEEVSQLIGRSRTRVGQIQDQALDKLRAMLAEEGTWSAVA